MKPASSVLTFLLTAALLSSCNVLTDKSPPKTRQEMEAEALAGKVPDTLRDPRPEMPPMGPLNMPMR